MPASSPFTVCQVLAVPFDDRGSGSWGAMGLCIKMTELRRGECQDAGARGVARMVPGGGDRPGMGGLLEGEPREAGRLLEEEGSEVVIVLDSGSRDFRVVGNHFCGVDVPGVGAAAVADVAEGELGRWNGWW